jgi:prepilin-type processing-associated H-X9-DG protein
MGNKPDLSTYVSSGQFADDIANLYPNGPFSPANAIPVEALDTLAEGIPTSVKKELLVFADLARDGKLPQLGRENKSVGLETIFEVGLSLVANFGDELEETFEDGGTEYEIAKTAIGLASNGGGVMHFLLADGHVAALDMGMYNQWLWNRFSSLGEYAWVVLHGRAAAAERYPVSELKATVAALDCALAAKDFDVPEEVLPPLPPMPDDTPNWLK